MHRNNTHIILRYALLLCTMCLLSACASKDAGTSTVLPERVDNSLAASSSDRSVTGTTGSTEGKLSESPPESPAQPASRMMVSIPASSEAVYPHLQTTVDESLDDYDIPASTISDPLEPWNRFWFSFNDVFYLYFARPVYTGYEFVTPSEFRTGLKNVLANLLFPVRFINSFLQGKPMAAGVEFGRFMLNSTLGFGGLIDVAKGVKAVVPVDPSGEDFGQTLGAWGVPQGFYVVWPIIGPSSARDSVGLAADSFLDPLYYLQPWEAAFIAAGSLRFNTMGDILTLYEDMNKSAVDPYVAMREAYAAYRQLRLKQ